MRLFEKRGSFSTKSRLLSFLEKTRVRNSAHARHISKLVELGFKGTLSNVVSWSSGRPLASIH